MTDQKRILVIITCMDFPEVVFYGYLCRTVTAEKSTAENLPDKQLHQEKTILKIEDAIDEDGNRLGFEKDRYGVCGIDRLIQFFPVEREFTITKDAYSAFMKNCSHTFEQDTQEHGIREFEIIRGTCSYSHGRNRSRRYLRENC